MSENEGPQPAEETDEAAKAEAVATDDLRTAREEARDLHDRLARVSAELDNYRKRQQREKEQAIAFANESLLLELIPVVDSFERAQSAKGDAQSVLRGVQLARKQLEDALARFGAVAFTTVGEPFDPAKAEAVAVREDISTPPGTVLDEHQRGWSLHGRLVRPARVVVAAEAGTGDGGDAVH